MKGEREGGEILGNKRGFSAYLNSAPDTLLLLLLLLLPLPLPLPLLSPSSGPSLTCSPTRVPPDLLEVLYHCTGLLFLFLSTGAIFLDSIAVEHYRPSLSVLFICITVSVSICITVSVSICITVTVLSICITVTVSICITVTVLSICITVTASICITVTVLSICITVIFL